MISKNLQEQIHLKIVEELENPKVNEEVLENIVSKNIDFDYPLLSLSDKSKLSTDVVNEILGYGFLENLLGDENANEIMINSPKEIYVDRNGEFQKIHIDVNENDLIKLTQKIAGAIGARCDVSSPILDAWLTDGSRVHVVLPPIAPDGPCITIRRFLKHNFSIKDFCHSEVYEEAIQQLIVERKNLVIAGPTSSGKTTFLNALMNEIPKSERIVSVEETSELSTSHLHWIRLVTRKPNSEGVGSISLGDLVKATLRMRPDRIVVGEVRSVESFDLMQALNTGHDGSLCTIHANSPVEVISRLASLSLLAHPGLNYESIKTQFCFGIDAVIYVTRESSGERKIKSISYLQRKGSSPCLIDFETGDKIDV